MCHDAGSSGSEADSPHGSNFASALHHASLKVASWNGEFTAWLLQLQGTAARILGHTFHIIVSYWDAGIRGWGCRA